MSKKHGPGLGPGPNLFQTRILAIFVSQNPSKVSEVSKSKLSGERQTPL